MQQSYLGWTYFALITGLIFTVQANAVPVAAQTRITTLSPCPSFCGGGPSESDSHGGEGFIISFSSIPAGVNGTGQAIAIQTGAGISLPNLGVDAFPDPNALSSQLQPACRNICIAELRVSSPWT